MQLYWSIFIVLEIFLKIAPFFLFLFNSKDLNFFSSYSDLRKGEVSLLPGSRYIHKFWPRTKNPILIFMWCTLMYFIVFIVYYLFIWSYSKNLTKHYLNKYLIYNTKNKTKINKVLIINKIKIKNVLINKQTKELLYCTKLKRL